MAENKEDDEILLLDFYADWCGPCKRQHDIVDDLEDALDEEYGDDGNPLEVVQIDVEQNEDISDAYDVRSLPTLVLKHGDVDDPDEGRIKEFIGVTAETDLREAIEEEHDA